MGMPVLDGASLAAEIREHSEVPVILLTGWGFDPNVLPEIPDGVSAVVSKPIDFQELRQLLAAYAPQEPTSSGS